MRPPTAQQRRLIELRNLALAWLEVERYEEAIGTLDELIALAPQEPMAHANRGLVELLLGGTDAAVPHLETAGRLAPDDPDVAMLRAVAAAYDADDERAIAILREAIAQHPDHLRARWALVEILRRSGPDAADELIEQLEDVVSSTPRNVLARLALVRAVLERADADRDDLARARTLLDELAAQDVVSDERSDALLDDALALVRAGDARSARSRVIGLDNLLKPSRAWQQSLLEVARPAGVVADPVPDFIATAVPAPPRPEPIDVAFEDVGDALGLTDVRAEHAALVVTDPEEAPVLLAAAGGTIEARPLDGAAPARVELDVRAGVVAVAPVDWNNDRRMDLVVGLADGSLRAALRGEQGDLDLVPIGDTLPPCPTPATFDVLVPWDVEPDGDLDLLVGRRGSRAVLVRNDEDGGNAEVAVELGLAREDGPGLRDAVVVDLDDDGDLDLVAIDGDGRAVRLENRRSGRFDRVGLATEGAGAECVAAADLDGDGWTDLVWLGDGVLRVVASKDGALDQALTLAKGIGTNDLAVLDYDNDGRLDVLAVAGGRPHLVRITESLQLVTAPLLPPADPLRGASPVDLDWDGDLDLFVAFEDGRCTVWDNVGGNANGWQKVRLDAIIEGGHRNNAFGLGGLVELRAGGAYQKRTVDGPVTHFGLGGSDRADVVRIVWPNGVPQDLVQPEPNRFVAEAQRLKGSCPFLLAHDGDGFAFVTDLLWRSPVGMRINAQTVARIVSTEDYVKIESGQLQPREEEYDLLITAALWETIFVDAVELWAVDHPDDVEILVDERFVAPEFPPFEIHVVDRLRTPRSAVDHRGRDVLDVLAERDRRRLGDFAKSRYQGIAEPHFVEVDLGPLDRAERVRLVASGWIMPTDTSINVALGQSGTRPMPLAVDVPDGRGGWIEAIPNAGFPAGKLKTIVLDLTGAFPTGDHRVRLRTNLEIYWDRIAFALGEPEFTATPAPRTLVRSDLESIGFPAMTRHDAQAPELPDYSAPQRRTPWRDLHGWYTRYGDVGTLLAAVDDRYVIMNAGDAIRLAFDAGPPPPPGWTRDFILFSDGWVKDGDLNTVASKTVAPLPYHGMTDYPYPRDGLPATLRPDHPDWTDFHTRYVNSDPFRERLRARPGRR